MEAGPCAIYSVTVHTDQEGKSSREVGWFLHERDAVKYAKGKDIYGHDGYVRQRPMLRVGHLYWRLPEYTDNTPVLLTSTSKLNADVSPWDI